MLVSDPFSCFLYLFAWSQDILLSTLNKYVSLQAVQISLSNLNSNSDDTHTQKWFHAGIKSGPGWKSFHLFHHLPFYLLMQTLPGTHKIAFPLYVSLRHSQCVTTLALRAHEILNSFSLHISDTMRERVVPPSLQPAGTHFWLHPGAKTLNVTACFSVSWRCGGGIFWVG